MEFDCEGDTKTYNATVMADDEEVHCVEPIGENVEHIGKYTTSYLKDLVKTNMGEQVQLRFSNNMPVSLVYRYEHATVTTFLAPRIEED